MIKIEKESKKEYDIRMASANPNVKMFNGKEFKFYCHAGLTGVVNAEYYVPNMVDALKREGCIARVTTGRQGKGHIVTTIWKRKK